MAAGEGHGAYACLLAGKLGLRGRVPDTLETSPPPKKQLRGPPSGEGNIVGFRVASSELSAVPEVTSSFTLLGLLSSGLLLRRRGWTSR